MTRKKTMRTVPFMEQMERSECGICCLKMLAKYYRSSVSFYELQERLSVGRDGISMYNLASTAESVGFTCSAVKVSLDGLESVSLPAILHWEQNHYVILEKIKNGTYFIVDPAKGKIRLSVTEMEKGFNGYAMLCQPQDKLWAVKKDSSTKAWRQYTYLLKQNKKLILSVLFMSGCLQIFTLGLPILTKFIIDALNEKNVNLFSLLGAATFFLILFQTCFSYLRTKVLIRLKNTLDLQMMSRFIQHFLSLPYKFFQLRTFGDLIFRANSNVHIREILSANVITSIFDSLLIVAMFSFAAYFSMTMGISVLLLILLSAATVLVFNPKLKHLSKETVMAQTAVQGAMSEMIYHIAAIKTTGTEERTYRNWNSRFVEYLRKVKSRDSAMNWLDSLNAGIQTIAPFIILWIGVMEMLNDRLTLGTLVAIFTMAGSLFLLVENLVRSVSQLIMLKAYLMRAGDILHARPEQDQSKQLKKLDKVSGSIELKDVTFKYSEFSEPSLQSISLSIQPGQKVAIVGPSGSGKSTLARLMIGLHQPNAGTICFDGISIRELDLPSLRKQIGVVSQETPIFNKTILENVSLYHEEATEEEIIKACKRSGIHNEIMAMPMHYFTPVAEGGADISGGQRQRIAIARALLKEPQILLLDEATSAVDNQNERHIHDQVRSIACTQIIIAHRLNTIKDADVIIVLENGRIVQAGRHEELLAANGLYKEMYGQEPAVQAV